jgi:hypothetical protein
MNGKHGAIETLKLKEQDFNNIRKDKIYYKENDIYRTYLNYKHFFKIWKKGYVLDAEDYITYLEK